MPEPPRPALGPSAQSLDDDLRQPLLSPRLIYPKSVRLRKRREFLATQRRGQRVHGAHLIVIAAQRQGPGLRLGITASKKVGGAVQRNRVKRRLREGFRLLRGQWRGGSADLVVIARHSAQAATFAELQKDLWQSIERAMAALAAGRRDSGGRSKSGKNKFPKPKTSGKDSGNSHQR